jgi:hypothetical protein
MLALADAPIANAPNPATAIPMDLNRDLIFMLPLS